MNFADLTRTLQAEKKTARNDIESFAHAVLRDQNLGDSKIFALIDTMGADPIWREEFNAQMKKETGQENFLNALSTEAIESQLELIKKQSPDPENFSTTAYLTGAGLSNLSQSVIQTDIMLAVDKLYTNFSPVLSRCTIDRTTNTVQVPEFTVERTATLGDENSALSPADDTPLQGESLNGNIKFSGSVNINERAMLSLSPALMAKMTARILRSIESQMVNQIFNGTNVNQFAGILGTDATYGSIAVTLTGVGLTNHIDAMDYIFDQLPDLVDSTEEQKYSYFVNRKTRGVIRRTKDLNNTFYRDSDTGTNRLLTTGLEIVTVPSLANNQVVLCDMSNVYLQIAKQLDFVVDYNPRSAGTEYAIIATTYADAGLMFGRKSTAQKNAFRHGTLLASYA